MAALLEKTQGERVGRRVTMHTRESTKLREAMEKAREIRLALASGAMTPKQAKSALNKLRQGRG